IVYLGTRATGEPPISTVHPSLLKICDLPAEPIDAGVVAKRADVVFLGVPHTAAMDLVPPLLEKGLRVIDHSADYRLKDAAVYEKWYGHAHADPANLAKAVYGLPEIYAKEIKAAQLVANPGCYPTAVILAAWPLIAKGLAEADFIADAKSGVSGAGRKLTDATHFPEANESVAPYKVGKHQHTPEMEQVLSDAAGRAVRVEFVPHLVPMDRGIEATLYLTPAASVTADAVTAAFEKSYRDEPFIRLRGGAFGRTRDVAYTNFCDIAWAVTERHIIVSSCIDNLVKGAAGQAVENMNVMFGLDRTEGLL
ncbi:MAG: N-acetyl-gamma-glutamyl-phosphate reductase, partial [Planctomycetota bacterium]